MAGQPLDAALDELYGSDASEFVAIRKRLVAELRSAGDKVAAKELQAARRPSTSAWAMNQLARLQPQTVERFLEKSNDLVAAQTRALSGRPDAMRDAIRAHREALDDAAGAALAILGTRSNDAFRNEIVATLRAASIDEDVGRQLQLGRLVREAESSGFPEATGLTLVPEPSGSAATTKREPARRRAEHRKAHDAALRQVAAAGAEAARAGERVEQLESELDAARRELREARDRSRKARADAARFGATIDTED